jgi:hypothetical protein
MTEQATTDVTPSVDRPLPATQVKNLKAIIETDHEMLRVQIHEFAAEQIQQKTREIEAAASPIAQREYEERARTLVMDFNRARRALIAEAQDAGLALNISESEERYISVRDDRTKESIARMTRDIERERNTALASLRQSQLEQTRKALKVGVSAAAEAVLTTMPTAQEAMSLAAATRSERLSLQ